MTLAGGGKPDQLPRRRFLWIKVVDPAALTLPRKGRSVCVRTVIVLKGKTKSAGNSATERVEVYIRDSIYSGLFKPRQRLTEEALAKTLHCSRGPIREAILRLERDGLVETVPRRGTFIPDISAESIEVVFSMRGKLEGLCVRYMRQSMNATKEQTLSSILEEMKAATKDEDNERFLAADLELHHTIWRFSEREALERTLSNVMNPRVFLIARTFSSALPIRQRYKDHEKYLDIVLSSPASKVEMAVEQHFSELHDRIFGGHSARHLIGVL
jgi:DNA-binding GntR family transcriptional regulator